MPVLIQPPHVAAILGDDVIEQILIGGRRQAGPTQRQHGGRDSAPPRRRLSRLPNPPGQGFFVVAKQPVAKKFSPVARKYCMVALPSPQGMLSGGRLEDRLMSHKSICVAALLANAQACSPALHAHFIAPRKADFWGAWLTLSDRFYTPTTSARITSDTAPERYHPQNGGRSWHSKHSPPSGK